MPAPASSTNENAICVVANTRRRRLVPGVIRTLPLARPRPAGRVRRRQARDVGEQHGRGHRQAGADPQHAGIDGDLERADREARGIAARRRATSGRASTTPSTAPAPQSTRLSASSVRRSAPVLGAERGAHGQLAFAAHRARQDQVGDVRAGDDEHDRGGGEQHEQDRPRRRRDLIAQRRDAQLDVRALPSTPRGARASWRRAPRSARRAPLRASRRARGGRTAPSSGACGW